MPFLLLALLANTPAAQTGRQARFNEAEKLTEQGLALFDADTRESLRAAAQKFEEALPLYHDTDTHSEAATLFFLGLTYNSLEEKQKALHYFERALPLFVALKDWQVTGYTLNNIGFIYFTFGEMGEAMAKYKLAGDFFRGIQDTYGLATTLNNLATVGSRLGFKKEAVVLLEKALPLFRAAEKRRGEAMVLDNLGGGYLDLGDHEKALFHLEQALRLRREDKDRRGEAMTLDSIGGVYVSLGDNGKALDYYREALPLRRSVGDRHGEAVTLYNTATTERRLGRYDDALAHSTEVLDIVESLRTTITNRGLSTAYFAIAQDYFEFHIRLLMHMHKYRPSEGYDRAAFHASERARGRALLDTLGEAGADIREGVEPALLERERSLRHRLNAQARRQSSLLSGRHKREEVDDVAEELQIITGALSQVESEIRQKSRRYAALTQPRPLALGEIQQQVLDDETVLLEYSLGKVHSYLWVVTKDSVTNYELPGREEIEAAARQVYELLTARAARPESERKAGRSDRLLVMERNTSARRRARIARADAQYPAAARRLSQMILAPAAGQLGRKRLLVVGDGALQYVPFAALPDPSEAGRGQPAPLVARHEVISLPSASTLAVLREEARGRAPAAKTLAVLADPVFESTDVRVLRSARAAAGAGGRVVVTAKGRELPLGLMRSVEESGLRSSGPTIPRLPWTRDEAARILELIPEAERKGAFDFDANRQAATGSDLSQYRFIHFATHGFLNSTHPELSGIVLSLVDEQGEQQNGFLRAHEIYNLKLAAELVVLSACQTGLGKEVKGEGLVGLTRGFMYAGTPRVVVSLWSVSDRATAELMGRFYRRMLKDKMRPAAALRAAQLSMTKERGWESPFYWAAFTLQGEWR